MSANPIVAFDFEEKPIRTVEQGGEPWFVLADLCRVLGHSNPTTLAARLDEDECSKISIGRQGEAVIVNESGMYSTILRSRGAATPGTPAHRFRRWIAGEVLPTIRKQGFYGNLPAIKSVQSLTALQNQVIKLTAKLQVTRNSVERQMMHQMLSNMCRQLGIETPPLDQLGADAPQPPDILLAFWHGLDLLKATGVNFNHSRAADKLAINLPEVRDHFKDNRIRVDISADLRKALRQSENPRFLGDRPVNSRITLKAKNCWVFMQP